MPLFSPPNIEQLIARMDERGLKKAQKYACKHGDAELEDSAREGWVEVTQLKMQPRNVQKKYAETRDPNPAVRVAAAKFIATERVYSNAFYRLMVDPDLTVRRTVAWILASKKSPLEPGFMIKFLSNPDEEIRAHTAHAMAYIVGWSVGLKYSSSPEETMDALASALKDTPKVRAEAAFALCHIFGGHLFMDGTVIASLIKQLAADPNPGVRLRMAQGLTEHYKNCNMILEKFLFVPAYEQKSIMFLFELLKDEDAEVRACVVEGLGAIGAKHYKSKDPFWKEFTDRLYQCMFEEKNIGMQIMLKDAITQTLKH